MKDGKEHNSANSWAPSQHTKCSLEQRFTQKGEVSSKISVCSVGQSPMASGSLLMAGTGGLDCTYPSVGKALIPSLRRRQGSGGPDILMALARCCVTHT